jgi:hypothetical protein
MLIYFSLEQVQTLAAQFHTYHSDGHIFDVLSNGNRNKIGNISGDFGQDVFGVKENNFSEEKADRATNFSRSFD